jgi:hypothetical protein
MFHTRRPERLHIMLGIRLGSMERVLTFFSSSKIMYLEKWIRRLEIITMPEATRTPGVP